MLWPPGSLGHTGGSTNQRARLGRRAQLLAAASVVYNVIEALIAIAAGLVAGSVALVGFGLDSVVEVSSGLIILWQFRHRMPESRERQALRLMAYSFFVLAAYVTFESVRALVSGHDPDPSPVGIGLAAASLAIMPFLSWAQRRTGKALGVQRGSGRLHPDPAVHLSVGRVAGSAWSSTRRWGGRGPPDRRPGHRRRRGQGRTRGLARRGLLRPHRRHNHPP